MTDKHHLEVTTKNRELCDALALRDKADSKLKTQLARYEASLGKIKKKAEADVAVAEAFSARNFAQMTTAQQHCATANACLKDMSLAVEVVEGAEIVATRKMEDAANKYKRKSKTEKK